MRRRSIVYIGILLLCFFIVSCRKTDSADPQLYGEEQAINQKMYHNVLRVEKPIGETPKEELEVVTEGINTITQGIPQEETNTIAKDIPQEETVLENDHNVVLLSEFMQAKDKKDSLRDYVRAFAAGTILTIDVEGDLALEELFYFEEIGEDIKVRITGKSYGENCDVAYSELRYIRVLYHSFEGQTQIGELIVNKSIAEDTVEIFKDLYKLDYRIERMVLVDDYNADDNTSMEANNTSAFNYRYIDGTTRRSLHSDGLAIDINPLYNPYVREINKKTVVLPENGTEYADRLKDCPYYIRKGDACYLAFTENGFIWGGDWNNQKDYQHFEKPLTE